jgi:uncharacterized protein
MSQRLPVRIDPWQVCEKGRDVEGSFPLDGFDRLAPLLASSRGEAAFALRFGRDGERRFTIRGSVSAELTLTCQRCFRPLVLDVDARVELGPVRGLEEAARLPASLEPLLVTENGIRLRELVEDELLMAIPSIPRHEEDDCAPMTPSAVSPTKSEDSDTDNPFAVLSALKQENDEGGS